MKETMTKGPFGLPMKDQAALALDSLLKTLPKDCQSLKHKASVPTSVELPPGERADISLVSVESIDREGEVVVSKGCDLTYFQRNPIVTFAHKYDELPVGKAAWIKKVPGALRAKTVYASKPEGWEGSWLPDAVWSMTREGILSGKSIGFLPTKIRPPDRTEAKWKDASAIIETSILLEFAIAPVPVNQDSLVEAVAKGYADAATLRRLGLPVPKMDVGKLTSRIAKELARATRPKFSTDDILLKALALIDPEEIAHRAMQILAGRGKV